jgi:hypothetical protein
MNVLRALFANAGMKLLALLLAWGLWFVVREDLDEVRDAVLRVSVRPVPGSNIDAAVENDQVTVRVRGPRRDVDQLVDVARELLVRVRPDDLNVDQLTAVRELGADDLLLPPPLPPDAVRIEEMSPETITVRLWRVERREVPVRTPEFPGLEDLNVSVERRSWPQKALVRGPADDLVKLPWLDSTVDREQLRRAVEAMGDSGRVSTSLPLLLTNAPTANFQVIEPRALEVRFDLVRSATLTVTVPLPLLDDAGARPRRIRVAPGDRPGIVAGTPPQIALELRGPPKALATVTPESIRAFLLASELPADAKSGELRVHTSDLPAGVSLAREPLTVPVEVVD